MGTIVSRKRANGSAAYMAKIILKREGRVVHRESKTFELHRHASNWVKARETELAKPGELERINKPRVRVGEAIERYIAESRKQIGKTKAQVLNAILALPIANLYCDEATSTEIVTFAKELSPGREPSTVGNYVSHLAAVFAVAKPAWDYPLDRQAMADAQVVCRRLGIIAKSKERDRRPTMDELDTVMEYYADRMVRGPKALPMTHIIAFAIFSTRRQEEITRIEWADLDEKNSRVMVRDMKNPGEKIGNDVWCDLPAQALEVIKIMPRVDACIFPYHCETVSTSFTRAGQVLGIEDLHFHDLRHDGISWLFERGYTIPKAAGVSGHRSWSSLKRYAHIREAGDKYANWRWMDFVTSPPQRLRKPLPARGSGEPS